MRSRTKIMILEIILLAIIATAVIAVAIYSIGIKRNLKTYETLQDMKIEGKFDISKKEGRVDETIVRENQERFELAKAPIPDFKELCDFNRDICAWIVIPGTCIDYPIVCRGNDNDYYLNHNVDGSLGWPGCLYIEDVNSKDFSDAMTIVYGHNMRNGSMFGELHQYENVEFFKENPIIKVYLPRNEDVQVENYEIVAVGTIGDEYIPNIVNLKDFTSGNTLTKMLKGRLEDEQPKDAKALVLSTCNGGRSDTRFLVIARLVSSEEVQLVLK